MPIITSFTGPNVVKYLSHAFYSRGTQISGLDGANLIGYASVTPDERREPTGTATPELTSYRITHHAVFRILCNGSSAMV